MRMIFFVIISLALLASTSSIYATFTCGSYTCEDYQTCGPVCPPGICQPWDQFCIDSNCPPGCIGSSPTPACFLPGTKISMADGTKKNIEDVTNTDMVKSYTPPYVEIYHDSGNITRIFQDDKTQKDHMIKNCDGKLVFVTYNTKYYNELNGVERVTYKNKLKLDIFDF